MYISAWCLIALRPSLNQLVYFVVLGNGEIMGVLVSFEFLETSGSGNWLRYSRVNRCCSYNSFHRHQLYFAYSVTRLFTYFCNNFTLYPFQNIFALKSYSRIITWMKATQCFRVGIKLMKMFLMIFEWAWQSWFYEI